MNFQTLNRMKSKLCRLALLLFLPAILAGTARAEAPFPGGGSYGCPSDQFMRLI
jgi:hypothetical protein